ncbi:uncharacterized protein LOC102679713 isoform X1 [Apis dorsata]|uniref:uncharacterized protein LOC102679713 isoform X1 n=2 Tax=Apis dorsata TaxID=7462 RepID=UPI0012938C12|nr:uncharacterized protein LOC102679713 isoform X1 [Apis dorsata]XP_031369840.1 uncharacterized protein LOC102679713 isoform X1 [Apis dorsata]
MQRWLLDEPASDLCSSNYQSQIKRMLERGKFYCNAAIATALAVSDENQINSDSEITKLSLHPSNERFAYNNLYAIPRADLHEIEWIEADSLDAYVSRFVTGLSTITRNNLRKCCRTSSYSNHSLPLSAGSYSCYTSAISNQNFFRGITMKNQSNGGLAIIHEAIPRPIWPMTFFNSRDLYQNNENPEYDTSYTYCGCCCAYSYSYCDWHYEKSINMSAHEVLLELSQTLDSMIEGKNIMTPEEILQNISYQIAQRIDFKGEFYEYVYHNSSFLSSKRSFLNDTNPYELSCNKNSSSKINPVNSKLYNNTRNSHLYNPWYTCLCTCERTRRFLSSKNDQENTMSDELKRKESPLMLLMDNQYQKIKSELLQNNIDNSKSYGCKCLNHSIFHNKKIKNVYMNRYIKNDIKETININEETKQDRNKIISNDPEYSKQLECSDGDSFNKDRIFSSNKNNWNYRMQGFAENLDFTLDVSRAERLGHVIAKAKRKRQWCRVLTAFFGLVFFVLSVVIVSLSVTKGRKVFGSM